MMGNKHKRMSGTLCVVIGLLVSTLVAKSSVSVVGLVVATAFVAIGFSILWSAHRYNKRGMRPKTVSQKIDDDLEELCDLHDRSDFVRDSSPDVLTIARRFNESDDEDAADVLRGGDVINKDTSESIN